MKKFFNHKVLTYKVFWIIWLFLVLAGLVALLDNPAGFNGSDSRSLVALIVTGVAFFFRQNKILLTKPTKGEFILGAILLLIEFPFLWIATVVLWSGLVRDIRKK